jgi:uncharacterized protein YlaI
MNCEGCQHHHGLQDTCMALVGHMLCKACDKPFSANIDDRPLRWFLCPACNHQGSSEAIEDVAGGRSRHCPGFVERVSLLMSQDAKPEKKTKKPSPQMELF